MTQNHHPRPQHTSNDGSSQAESSSAEFESVQKFKEAEQAEAAEKLSSSGPHCFNADRVSSEVGRKPGEVRTCITDLSKLSVVSAGVDWCKLYAQGTPVDPEICNELEAYKEKAKESQRGVYVELAGINWKVEPRGDGDGANHLPYLLTCAGLRLALGRRTGSGAVAMIEAQGRYCAGRDPQVLHKELKAIVCKAGVQPTRFIVSRLDIYGDVAGVPVSRVIKAFMSGNVVKRSRKWNFEGEGHFEQSTGIYFGKRGQAVMARIYDKVAELEKNEDKRTAFLTVHGLESLPPVVTRVEFEVLADFFRETWKAANSDEVFAALGSISRYLMKDWLRVCFHVDRNNTQKAKACSWWQHLGEKIAQRMHYFAPRCDVPPLLPSRVKLKAQVLGCVAALNAMLGFAPQNVEAAFDNVRAICTDLDAVYLRDRSEDRCLEFDQRKKQWEQRSSQALESCE